MFIVVLGVVVSVALGNRELLSACTTAKPLYLADAVAGATLDRLHLFAFDGGVSTPARVSTNAPTKGASTCGILCTVNASMRPGATSPLTPKRLEALALSVLNYTSAVPIVGLSLVAPSTLVTKKSTTSSSELRAGETAFGRLIDAVLKQLQTNFDSGAVPSLEASREPHSSAAAAAAHAASTGERIRHVFGAAVTAHRASRAPPVSELKAALSRPDGLDGQCGYVAFRFVDAAVTPEEVSKPAMLPRDHAPLLVALLDALQLTSADSDKDLAALTELVSETKKALAARRANVTVAATTAGTSGTAANVTFSPPGRDSGIASVVELFPQHVPAGAKCVVPWCMAPVNNKKEDRGRTVQHGWHRELHDAGAQDASVGGSSGGVLGTLYGWAYRLVVIALLAIAAVVGTLIVSIVVNERRSPSIR